MRHKEGKDCRMALEEERFWSQGKPFLFFPRETHFACIFLMSHALSNNIVLSVKFPLFHFKLKNKHMHRTWADLWLYKNSVNVVIDMQWFKQTKTDEIITVSLTRF